MPTCPQTFVPNWTLNFPAASPSAREQFAMAYDAMHGRVVLFGGFNGSSYVSDTWLWNGTTWALQTPTSSPTARYGACMAYDAAQGNVVLFGGDGPSGYLNDTWVWDGANWTEESPSSSPPERYAATMAYDAAHSQVVLFGGYNSISGALGDTWAWNGNNWALETPATSPSARYAAAMAFDAAHGQTVLFGGFSGSAYLGDTWVWNGTGWTNENPATSPSARIGPAAAYDVALGHVVLFGGYEGDDLGDTWVWGGTNWTQEASATSPTGRQNSSMAYDAAHGHVVLFGGFRGSSSLADTWDYGQGDFGSVSISATGTAQMLDFSIPGGTTVGSIGVLTQGAPNLDFTDVGDGTCTATTYASATNCAVDVQFAPRFAGLRMGAVVFKDGSGNVLSTTYIYGIGAGPQIAFEPAAITLMGGGGFSAPEGVAVDGIGNVYLADYGDSAVYEMSAGCASASCVTRLGGSFYQPWGLTVDGIGNVYVADTGHSAVKEMPPGCSSSSCVTKLGGGFSHPTGTAVDGNGDVYVGDYLNNAVKEMPPGCATSSCVTTLGAGFSFPRGVAVDGGGNVYVADSGNSAVKEMPAGCASSSCVNTLGGGFSIPTGIAVDGAGNVYVADGANNAAYEMPPGCASSSCVTVLGGGFDEPEGVTLDGSGNVYVGDSNNNAVKELNAATPPTLSFPTATAVGSTDTTDGTLTAQVFNIGNASLVFSDLAYPTDFVEASDTNPCTSTTTLSAGQECDVPVQFAPQNPGSPLSENVTLTNNNLNGTNVQQSIPLSGTAEEPAGTMFSPPPGSTLTAATITFRWNAGLTGVTGYYLWIGTTPGGYDLANQGPFSGTTATVTLPINGAPIYVRLWTFLNGGATQLYNDYTYTEATPSAAAITSPSNGSSLTSASTTFNWSPGSGGVTAYYLWIGTTPGAADLVNIGPLSTTSATVNLPTNGTPIYVRLWTFINGGSTQLHNDYTYTEAGPAAITSPTAGSTLTSASTTFNWSAGPTGATYYLWIGTTPGGYDLANMGPISGTSAAVNLPTNGAAIYVRLWTFINGGATQFHNDYTYTENSPAAAAITSPSNGSALLSASTTFNWSAGSGGAITYYLWVGTSPGAANLINIGPLSGTSAIVNLATNGTPIYVRLWTFINGGATQLSNNYNYTEATVAAAAITSPSNASTLAGASTTFNWNPGSGGVTGYYLWVGTTPGTADVANIGPISGTSATVTLPTNGVPIYVRLWTFINGGATQLSNDYAYTEAGP